ncbi:MAG: vWA domain-containing protein [Planctomycetota bacterium]|jgi:Ca-activated chloride channel family protein
MSFHPESLWWLLLLPAGLLAWWRWWSPRRRPAVTFSDIGAARRAGASWAVRLRWIVPALRTAAIVLLVVALARPRLADEQSRVFTEGVAIELVVDRSGSMRAVDFELDGQRTSRLEAVKRVVEQFVLGGSSLPGRPDDLIGLIVFARYADSRCPLTLDHDHLIDTVRTTQFVGVQNRDEEDGTGIGDALGLAVERLQSLDQRVEVRSADRIESKVIILLTDGENNVGDLDPLTAADMAAAFGIRVYTIGAGTDAAFAPVPVTVGGRTVTRRMAVGLDEQTLRGIADRTGGRYFRATDTDSLEEIYARIDELERTEIEQRRYTDYQELAVEPTRLGGLAVPPLLAVVLLLLGLEVLLTSTRLRTLP